MDEHPPDPAADDVLASLDDLRGRIEAARAASPGNRPAPRRRRGPVLVGLLAVVALVVGLFTLGGGDDDDADLASDATVTTAIGEAAPTVTAAPQVEGTPTTAAPTTAAPTTVAPTTAVPTTTVPPTTAPPTTAAPTTAPPTTAPPTTAPAPDPSVSDGPSGSDGSSSATEVVVQPGDSFWTIAEDAAAERLGRSPTVGEVAAVWLTVLDANADRLPDPGNFDLIHPGQIMLVPAAGTGP